MASELNLVLHGRTLLKLLDPHPLYTLSTAVIPLKISILLPRGMDEERRSTNGD